MFHIIDSTVDSRQNKCEVEWARRLLLRSQSDLIRKFTIWSRRSWFVRSACRR